MVAAHDGAVNARRAGLCQLRNLVTTPEPLRGELRPMTRTQLLHRLAASLQPIRVVSGGGGIRTLEGPIGP